MGPFVQAAALAAIFGAAGFKIAPSARRIAYGCLYSYCTAKAVPTKGKALAYVFPNPVPSSYLITKFRAKHQLAWGNTHAHWRFT